MSQQRFDVAAASLVLILCVTTVVTRQCGWFRHGMVEDMVERSCVSENIRIVMQANYPQVRQVKITRCHTVSESLPLHIE